MWSESRQPTSGFHFALIEALRSEDGLEAVCTFQQKRKPVWRGR